MVSLVLLGVPFLRTPFSKWLGRGICARFGRSMQPSPKVVTIRAGRGPSQGSRQISGGAHSSLPRSLLLCPSSTGAKQTLGCSTEVVATQMQQILRALAAEFLLQSPFEGLATFVFTDFPESSHFSPTSVLHTDFSVVLQIIVLLWRNSWWLITRS